MTNLRCKPTPHFMPLWSRSMSISTTWLNWIGRDLWHIGKKSDGFFIPAHRSDILISSWRASQISIRLTKIGSDKAKLECIDIGTRPRLYFPRNILAAATLAPGAGNDPREFIIIPPSLISRITCKKHTEQEISQNRCVQSINPGFLPSCQIINLSEYKKWEYVRGSHRLRLMVTWSRSFA